GVDAVKSVVRRFERLHSDISINDKTLSWDGYIQVYNGPIQKKGDLNGKIPVQVKGTKVSSFSDVSRKYTIEVTDLKNYKLDGGAMYFVVEIIDFDNTKVF